MRYPLLFGIALVASTAFCGEMSPTFGTHVPLFSNLQWGADETKMLEQKKIEKFDLPKRKSIPGLPKITIQGLDFFVSLNFGKIERGLDVTGLSQVSAIHLTKYHQSRDCDENDVAKIVKFVLANRFLEVPDESEAARAFPPQSHA